MRGKQRLRQGDVLCVSWVKGKDAKRILFEYREVTEAIKPGDVSDKYALGDALGRCVPAAARRSDPRGQPASPAGGCALSGAFATVHEAVSREDGKAVAIKVIDKRRYLMKSMSGGGSGGGGRDTLRDEVRILQDVDHRNIIKVRDPAGRGGPAARPLSARGPRCSRRSRRTSTCTL